MSTEQIKDILALLESAPKEKLKLEKLPYGTGALAPVMNKNLVEYHYGELARGYVNRYNRGEGDATFNRAGAFLHNIFFPQMQAPRQNNRPTGVSLDLINRKFGSFAKFKDAVKLEAMKVQGSGWVYLSKSGDIKTIKNHQIKNDIVLLIDMWEHAFNRQYGSDKAKYLNELWRIINWNYVNNRISGSKK